MNNQLPSPPRKAGLLLKFLGSMNLAITLLVGLSIAAIIGTVLQQNQPYTDYVIKFGPFWFEVFQKLALYDVYSSAWFLLILFFLVLSTSTCVYRNTPGMLRDMREYKQNAKLKTLLNYSNCQHWQLKGSMAEAQDVAQKLLRYNGYSARVKIESTHTLISSMKGSGSRLGYIFTHLSIVLICLGGLIDGNAVLKVREMLGQIVPETRDLLANEVPAVSHLSVNNPAFRGSVSIPEGGQADVLFINYRDGYLVQDLPFSIEVKDFRMEHYTSGQPKSFESDLLIHDKRLPEPLKKTISVNHPLIYNGYSIYQASFSDGGSGLGLLAWPLDKGSEQTMVVDTQVGDTLEMTLFSESWTLEPSNFRLFNINPSEDPAKKFKNVGPSMQFKMRNKLGEAREYLNYMLPVERDGAFYYLSGMRASPAEEFRYLYIPVDDKGGLDRFMRYLHALSDKALVRNIVAKQSVIGSSLPLKESAQLNDAMVRLAGLFVEQGMQGVFSQLDNNVPDEKRDEVAKLYVRVLQQLLAAVYVEVLAEEGIDVSLGVDEKRATFFDEATAAIGAIGRYGSPVYFQLTSFNHHQASGLQITKAPGKNLVYPGCALLVLGVFLMFYAPQRRLWIWLEQSDGGIKMVLAGHTNKNKMDFAKQYQQLRDQFGRVLMS